MAVPSQLQDALGASYTFHRELGGGGMARVFLAEDKRLHRQVVVKTLAPEVASGVSVERFAREIRTSAALQQANIVPLLDAGDAAGTAYFTMPYVEGESLRARLDKAGSLPVGEALSIVRDVARALAYAHERGVVHRDIKPDNILLSGATAVVSDFGIAKAVTAARRADESSTLTQFGAAVGTPAYMAPEQVAADPHVDAHADLYALGCTAYEMLAGTPPFVAATVQQLMAAHLDQHPRDIHALRPRIPLALGDLVMQCLEKNPADRPSAAEVLLRLDAPGGTIGAATIAVRAPGFNRQAFGLYAAAFIAVGAVARLAISFTGLPDWAFSGALVVMALGLPVLVLTAAGASRHLSWRRAALGGFMALSSFVVIVSGYMALRSLGIGPAGSLLAAGRVQRQQPVLVAELRSVGPDSTLGSVMSQAIRADLNQSTVVKVVRPSQIASALQRMRIPLATPLNFALAQEVARREGIPAVVDGEVRPLGAGFLLSIRLIQADSGQTLAAFQASADSPTQLIETLGSLTRRLRGKIGESLKDVRESAPLERVTTASLAALQKYTAAEHAFNVQDRARFLRNMEEAIALDTGFAMAYRRLATELTNRGGQRRRTEQVMRQAVAHAERLAPTERYLTIASYALMPDHLDLERALDALQRVVEVDSTNGAAWNNIGLIYNVRRDFARAEQAYDRARQADPELATPYLNLAFVKYARGGMAALQPHLDEMRRRFPQRPLTHGMVRQALLAQGQRDSAAKLMMAVYDSTAAGGSSEPSAYYLAVIRGSQGRIAESVEWLRRWNVVRAHRGAVGTDVELALDRAWLEGWHLEHRDRAGRMVDSLVANAAYARLDDMEKPYDFVATVYAMVGRADRAHAVLAEAERVDGWSANVPAFVADNRERARHSSRGWIALAERRYADAEREFREADAGDCLSCALPTLAMAFDLAGRADSAVATYERYLTTRELGKDTDRDFLGPTYKRLGELYEARGDRQQAAGYYLKFVDLWKNADAALQPKVAEVRRRVARLSDVERR